MQLELDLFLVNVPGGVFSPTFLRTGVVEGWGVERAGEEAVETEILGSRFKEAITGCTSEVFLLRVEESLLEVPWQILDPVSVLDRDSLDTDISLKK